MPTIKEMLFDIANREEYEQIRDYCIQCKGTGHIHLLSEIEGRTKPHDILCAPCNGVGYTLRENYDLIKTLFEKNTGYNLVLENLEYNFWGCYIADTLDKNADMVVENNKHFALIGRIYSWYKHKNVNKSKKNVTRKIFK